MEGLPELGRSIELVQLLQGGDREACNELLARYRPRLLRIVRVKLGSDLRRRLDEEDIVQEALLVADRRFPDFELRSHAGILQWLTRIAENVILQNRERHSAEKRHVGREVAARPSTQDSATELPLEATGPSPSQLAARAELEELVDAQVEALDPPEYREVILRRDYYQDEWEDVRRALGRPTAAAVQELYRRAHRKLRERLRKHLGG